MEEASPPPSRDADDLESLKPMDFMFYTDREIATQPLIVFDELAVRNGEVVEKFRELRRVVGEGFRILFEVHSKAEKVVGAAVQKNRERLRGDHDPAVPMGGRPSSGGLRREKEGEDTTAPGDTPKMFVPPGAETSESWQRVRDAIGARLEAAYNENNPKEEPTGFSREWLERIQQTFRRSHERFLAWERDLPRSVGDLLAEFVATTYLYTVHAMRIFDALSSSHGSSKTPELSERTNKKIAKSSRFPFWSVTDAGDVEIRDHAEADQWEDQDRVGSLYSSDGGHHGTLRASFLIAGNHNAPIHDLRSGKHDLFSAGEKSELYDHLLEAQTRDDVAKKQYKRECCVYSSVSVRPFFY